MHDLTSALVAARFVAPIAGVPEVQARALDRRHRLDRQQRSFRGPSRGVDVAPSPVTASASAGPARA